MRERSNKECETDLECFFSVQRLHGFRQVVTHVQSQQKDELQLSCKAVYLSIATKALVVDMVATPWARHILTTRLHPQNPAFPHLRSTHLRTRSTFTDVGLPSGFSNPLPSWRQALSEQGCRNCILPPPIVHAFYGSKVDIGKKLQQWQWQGSRPLAVALIGVDQLPPLWTHPTGSDFVRGSKLVAKPHVAEQRKLTRTQVLLLQSLWTPVERLHHSNNHAPWPQTCQATYVLCGQNASLQLPTDQIRPLLEALQTRLRIDSSNSELAINEILASHADPKYHDWKKVIMETTSWQLNHTDTGYLDVQCTGLGGGELDKDWEVLLACRKEAHVYGPSRAGPTPSSKGGLKGGLKGEGACPLPPPSKGRSLKGRRLKGGLKGVLKGGLKGGA